MTLKDIESDQRFILATGYAYNNGIEWISDRTYDLGIRYLMRVRDEHYDLWCQSKVYPDIFIDDNAWTYTSQHFPNNDVVKGWYEEFRERNG